jgi:hypothetical protein
MGGKKMKIAKWVIIGVVVLFLAIGVYVKCSGIPYHIPGTSIGQEEGPVK